MSAELKSCPVCLYGSKIVVHAGVASDERLVDCPRCGSYYIKKSQISGSLNIDECDRPIISGHIRNHQEQEQSPCLVLMHSDTKAIAFETAPTCDEDKAMHILAHIKRKAPRGKELKVFLDRDFSLGYCQDTHEFWYLLKSFLETENLIEIPITAHGMIVCRVTREGWNTESSTLQIKNFNHSELAKASIDYIAESRIEQLRRIQNPKFHLGKLIVLLEELNFNMAQNNLISAAFLTRTILNHVPPIFGEKTFSAIVDHGKIGLSKKKVFRNLNETHRNIADYHLHTPISGQDTLPTFQQVECKASLDFLLEEIIHALQSAN